MHGAPRGAAPGAEVQRGGELDEPFEERTLLGIRFAPGVLPYLLRREIAAAIEEAGSAANGIRTHPAEHTRRSRSRSVARFAAVARKRNVCLLPAGTTSDVNAVQRLPASDGW